DYFWLIEPLTGLIDFTRGIAHFADRVAFGSRGRIEPAVIIDPERQEDFTASRATGAAFSRRDTRVSQQKSIDDALVGTGFPAGEGQLEDMDSYMSMFKDLAVQSAGIRRAGTTSLDLAYVAAGRYDAFWEYGLSEFDLAAGALLVQEAGGLVSDFN